MQQKNAFLPVTAADVKKLGWESIDVILFSGDAYIDHPSFGIAIIARLLESQGYKVAVVPQPNWQDDLRDFKKLGKPNLFFGVSSGNMDSMINHYTANKRLRSDDAYTPGNRSGQRPDYATTVYSSILKKLFPETPVVIGGIEASLRRLVHYDYWSNKLKTSIIEDSKADLLVYGMGEKAIIEIADRLKKGENINKIKNIKQTAFPSNELNSDFTDAIKLYSYNECKNDKIKFADSFKQIETNSNKYSPKKIIQKQKAITVVVNEPFPPLNEKEMDEIYDLPFAGMPHPKYRKKPDIPAFNMIKNSVNIHRGCFGGCSFCAIYAHQRKFISSRSEKSILNEINGLKQKSYFKKTISDLGGPTANMYGLTPYNISVCESCTRNSCIYPKVCKNLNTDHSRLNELYEKVRNTKGVNNIFIGSGIRYDLFFKNGRIQEKDKKKYFENLLKYHVSGKFKIAPEHSSDKVLKSMRKPGFDFFRKIIKYFNDFNKKNKKNNLIVPYLISAHPDSGNTEMAELAAELKDLNIKPEQVQTFTPGPFTLSSVMYYTGYNPYTKKKVYAIKDKKGRKLQQSFIFWYKRENKQEIINCLKKSGKKYLIKKLYS